MCFYWFFLSLFCLDLHPFSLLLSQLLKLFTCLALDFFLFVNFFHTYTYMDYRVYCEMEVCDPFPYVAPSSLCMSLDFVFQARRTASCVDVPCCCCDNSNSWSSEREREREREAREADTVGSVGSLSFFPFESRNSPCSFSTPMRCERPRTCTR